MDLKTVDIKGTAYVTVNERIKAFWELYPHGRILTQLISNVDGICVFKAEIYTDKEDIRPSATGYAYEKENSTFINKTSYIENCETSAIGRALGIKGIGIDTSVASAEEVTTAMENQKKIDATKLLALEKALDTYKIPNETVAEVLEQFGYKKASDILVCDYMKICNEFKEVAK